MNTFFKNLKRLSITCLKISVAIGLLASCENETSSDDIFNGVQTGINVKNLTNLGGGNASFTTNLMAGQHHVAGSLTVSTDNTNLYVAYKANCSVETGSWTLKATHLYVGDCEAMPITAKGNPKIGKFPYKTEHGSGVSEYIYSIPLSEIDSCFCLAAHAEVDCGGECDDSVDFETEADGYCGEETAWAEGNEFPGNSWAMYVEFCMDDPGEEEVPVDEEIEEDPEPEEEETEEDPAPEEEETEEEFLD